MSVRPEVVPFLLAAVAIGVAVSLILRLFRQPSRTAGLAALITTVILGAYMLYFFRDPVRTAPQDPRAVVAGADGKVMRISYMHEDKFLKTDVVRISIFLSLFDVHVNRAPVDGKITYLGYFPGSRFFTFQDKSSDLNQHSSILIEGGRTRCLVNQIVGPVARRVVYWLTLDQQVASGDSIGMMKFGSRLDMYLPKSEVALRVKEGDKVRAGETVVATVNEGTSP